MTYSDIVKVLRDYGPVEGNFVASRLGLSVAETRKYLDALEQAGVITRHGYIVMLEGDSRSGATAANSRS